MIINFHHVSAAGSIELVSVNVPFANLQWTRKLSTCGEFAMEMACPLPVEWPGRYIVTSDERDEVGVIEKVESGDGTVTVSGRFAECLFDRYQFGPTGAAARGANWRQAVTAALSAWHENDIPPVTMGTGTQASSGTSYAISGGAGDSAMETIYSCTAGNGARPLIAYDRETDSAHMTARIIDGVDRTRSQSAVPPVVLAAYLGSAQAVDYTGDYSTSCSEVIAYAEKETDGSKTAVSRTVAVPGFDAATQWKARAYEDVGSLLDQDATPTAALVDSAGLLRTYDHMPDLAVTCTVGGWGYLTDWDLGDLVEAELPEMGITATARVEEVREVWKPGESPGIEADVGTKRISRVRRALMGRR